MMTAVNVTAKILEHLRANSGLDLHRPYLGISQIANCPRKLYLDFLDGRRDVTNAGHLYCYVGYLFERDLKSRLQAIGVYKPGSEREIIAEFDSRFRGHTDGETPWGTLLEIKSINAVGFERITKDRRAKREHYGQVQLYMRYGRYREALIIYICRDTFAHLAFDVYSNERIAGELEDKARRVLAAIDSQTPPACECGRC